MSNEQDNTAIVAIVIALIAFFVTTAQLLQALFGTAEGYRRCQASVIGPWAKLTKRVWRWSEFRFETLFTTPHISLQPMEEGAPAACDAFIEGTLSSRRETYCDGIYKDRVVRRRWKRDGTLQVIKRHNSERADDLVSWLGLVNMLHRLQCYHPLHHPSDNDWVSATMMPCRMSCPAITFRTRSWDFMPPDIVRPFATSNVGDTIALAHRLGMRWKDIRPGDGVMRAEGNGQSVTSTSVRGFGLLLQYTYDVSIVRIQTGIRNKDDLSTPTIASREADMLGFQITPRTYGIPNFIFGTPMDTSTITRAMNQLGLNQDIQDMYVNYFKKSKRLYGFSDLIGMVTCFLPLQGSSIVQVFSPYPDAHDSPTNWWEGFVVYHARLLECVDDQIKTGDESKQMQWVLDKFEYMRRTYPWNQCPSWEAESMNKKTKNRSIAFLNDLRDIWSTATDYFRDLSPNFRYRDLVGAHIAQAVYYPDLAEANIKAGTDKRYDLGAGRSQRVAEGMHIYVDQIPKVVDFMKEKGFDDEKVVREAWWTLILKAMCWHRSVALMEFQPSNAVPPSFHDSRIPVYIA